MAKQTRYYTVQEWMVSELGLTGDELTVYAILWGFSQDGETASRTPQQYFRFWTGKGKDATISTINALVSKGLVERTQEPGKTPEYRCKIEPVGLFDPSENQRGVVGKTDPYPSGKPTPINNINNNIKAQYARAHELFNKWWELYPGASKPGKGGCMSYWDNLTEGEQLQVIEHTKQYAAKAVAPLAPYGYLVTYQYWRNERPQEQRGDKPVQDDKPSAAGKVMVRVDGELQLMDKEEAKAKGLKILQEYGK